MTPLTGVPDHGEDHPRLHLLGRFELVQAGGRVDLAAAAQRVIALLALLGGTAHRMRVAGTLWPDHTDERALSNLRSTMWRAPEVARDLVVRRGNQVNLAGVAWIDYVAASDLATTLLDDPGKEPTDAVDRRLLTLDLLPNEDDEWLTVPREQHRQRRLHALEQLALHDLSEGRPLDAVDTALAAIAADPLRESSQHILVRAHLAAGNRAAALAHFERFRAMLARDLGVTPSGGLVDLVAETHPVQVSARSGRLGSVGDSGGAGSQH